VIKIKKELFRDVVSGEEIRIACVDTTQKERKRATSDAENNCKKIFK
tara:strand:+ start:32 stop:172 length:141 start_codon:yes stop_codon:yes gene_type:complete